jgi:branched-chain amino acid transport system permease protein
MYTMILAEREALSRHDVSSIRFAMCGSAEVPEELLDEFAGLAGALNAFHERIASPETLGWALSGDAVLYATLGGTGTLLGPVLGAAIVIAAREILSDFFRSWLIFVGVTYIALVFFLPNGLHPLLFPERRR